MTNTDVKKAYEFRKLKATDLFLVLNLVKKIGLNNLTKAYENGIDTIVKVNEKTNEDAIKPTDEDYSKVGIAMFNVFQVIIERISDCENEIYELLEATSNLSMEEIRNLDINTFIEMIKEFVLKKEFVDLFTQAVSLFSTAK